MTAEKLNPCFSRREIQIALLDILLAVDVFCQEHGIRYSLAYGTLLGAIRHQGFIPWDDDIDILMPRPDFERFIKEFHAPHLRCLYQAEGAFMHYFAKVEDTRTISIEQRHDYHFGLNIDVFPVDGKPDDLSLQKQHERRLGHFVHRIFLRHRRLLSLRDPLFAKIGAYLHSPGYWVQKTVRLMKQYPFATSRYCGSVCTSYSGLIEIFPREIFEQYSEALFEGHRFPILKDFDRVLRQQFGDYMTLPPLNKRKVHHLTVRWK